MEGKRFEQNFIPENKKESSMAPVAETTAEDAERDLKILRDRMHDPEGISEESTTDALGRLFRAAENNLQIRAELENFSKKYKENLSGDEEEDPKFIRNSEIYKIIYDWSEKQRLGKFYYDKENPRRKLGV